MSRMIFVNLPVASLAASEQFYTALGFTKNPAFSDDTAICMVLSESIYAMLLTHEKWAHFNKRDLPAPGSSGVMLAVNCDTRDDVDRWASAAAANGGVADANEPQDLGFMFSRALADPDGHIWEAFWMDPAAVPPADA